MIVTAYIDESGTQDGAPHLVMGGVVGTLGQWNALELKWTRRLKESGLDCFHSKDIVKNSGSQVKNVGYEGRVALTHDLQKIYKKHTLFSLVVILNWHDFRTHYLAGSTKGWHSGSAWGVCFRAGLSLILEILRSEFPSTLIDLHVILESGNKNAGDIVRLQEVFQRSGEPALVGMLKSVSFLDKRQAAGLQAADMFAYTAYSRGTDGIDRSRGSLATLKAREKLPKGTLKTARANSRTHYPTFSLELKEEWLKELRTALMARRQRSERLRQQTP